MYVLDLWPWLWIEPSKTRCVCTNWWFSLGYILSQKSSPPLWLSPLSPLLSIWPLNYFFAFVSSELTDNDLTPNFSTGTHVKLLDLSVYVSNLDMYVYSANYPIVVDHAHLAPAALSFKGIDIPQFGNLSFN